MPSYSFFDRVLRFFIWRWKKMEISNYFQRKNNIWLKMFLWIVEVKFWQTCFKFLPTFWKNNAQSAGKNVRIQDWRKVFFPQEVNMDKLNAVLITLPTFSTRKRKKIDSRNKNLNTYSLVFWKQKNFPHKVIPDK